MNKMKPFDKGVIVFTLVTFTGLLVLCTYAYLEAQKSIGGIKKAVTIVSTATHKTTAEIARILQASNGVFQKIQHNVGDLISVLRTDSENGIYEVTQKFTLLQTNLNHAILSIRGGVYQDTTISKLAAASNLNVHRVLSNTLYMSPVAPFIMFSTVNKVPFPTNPETHRVTFSVDSLTSATVHWHYNPLNSDTARADVSDQRVYIRKSNVILLKQQLQITSGWTEEDTFLEQNLLSLQNYVVGDYWQWKFTADQITDLMANKSISTTIEWEPIDED